MKIIFTCGGTAGHINPAVALARMFQERVEGCQVLFVGAKGGMEERLVPKEGFPLETVTISSFWRSLRPSGIQHNLRTLRNLSVSKREAARILDAFQPDLVVGTGGMPPTPWSTPQPAGASPRQCMSPTRCLGSPPSGWPRWQTG